MVCCKNCVHFETMYQWCGNDFIFGSCDIDDMVFFQNNFDMLTKGECDLYVPVDVDDPKTKCNQA